MFGAHSAVLTNQIWQQRAHLKSATHVGCGCYTWVHRRWLWLKCAGGGSGIDPLCDCCIDVPVLCVKLHSLCCQHAAREDPSTFHFVPSRQTTSHHVTPHHTPSSNFVQCLVLEAHGSRAAYRLVWFHHLLHCNSTCRRSYTRPLYLSALALGVCVFPNVSLSPFRTTILHLRLSTQSRGRPSHCFTLRHTRTNVHTANATCSLLTRAAILPLTVTLG
jgi:hypothetical protein